MEISIIEGKSYLSNLVSDGKIYLVLRWFVESGRDDNTNGREYLKSKWMLDIGLHGNVNIKTLEHFTMQ